MAPRPIAVTHDDHGESFHDVLAGFSHETDFYLVVSDPYALPGSPPFVILELGDDCDLDLIG